MTTEHISPEAFAVSKEFTALTPCEQEWVVVFAKTRDAGAATQAAYPKNKNQRVRTWQLQNNPKVIAALELWDGVSVRDAAIAGLQKDIRKLRGTARVEAKKLLFTLQGLIQ